MHRCRGSSLSKPRYPRRSSRTFVPVVAGEIVRPSATRSYRFETTNPAAKLCDALGGGTPKDVQRLRRHAPNARIRSGCAAMSSARRSSRSSHRLRRRRVVRCPSPSLASRRAFDGRRSERASDRGTATIRYLSAQRLLKGPEKPLPTLSRAVSSQKYAPPPREGLLRRNEASGGTEAKALSLLCCGYTRCGT